MQLDVRKGCICANRGEPDSSGIRFIDPCCRVHYAERAILVTAPDPETEITDAEIAEWRRREQQQPRKRVCYPKMTVAK